MCVFKWNRTSRTPLSEALDAIDTCINYLFPPPSHLLVLSPVFCLSFEANRAWAKKVRLSLLQYMFLFLLRLCLLLSFVLYSSTKSSNVTHERLVVFNTRVNSLTLSPGDLCEEVVDPCLQSFDPCQHDSKCVHVGRSYRWVTASRKFST